MRLKLQEFIKDFDNNLKIRYDFEVKTMVNRQ